MKLWPQIRDIGLFLGGMGGVIHETLLSHAERPTLLILFAAMMGLPAFLPGGAGELSERAQKQRDRLDREEQERKDIQAEVERQLQTRREQK